MKFKTTSLAVLAAFTIAGSANAVTLLQDTFTTTATSEDVNFELGSGRQSGTLSTSSWIDHTSNAGWQTQITTTGEMLLAGAESVHLNNDFATATTGVLTISFDLRLAEDWTGPENNFEWCGIAIDTTAYGTTPMPWDGTLELSTLFKEDGTTGVFRPESQTASNWSANSSNFSTITLTLADTVGTGSAFTGNGSIAKLYSDNILLGTFDLGNISAAHIMLGSSNSLWFVDDFSVTTIPEPRAALLGGLGMLALLRRRR